VRRGHRVTVADKHFTGDGVPGDMDRHADITTVDRRTLLAAAGAGTAALAGCSAAASIPPPVVSDQRLESGGWEQVDETTDTSRYAGVSATKHTLTFNDANLSEALEEQTLGSVKTELSVFFASRVEFSPPLDGLPLGIGRREVMDATGRNAKAEFETRLEENGLTDITEAGESTLTVDTGEEANLVEYDAVFPMDDYRFDVTEGRTIEIEGQPIDVAGWLAVWHHDGSALVAGGIHADENYTDSVGKRLSSAIELALDIDLGLTPEAYRDEVFGLMRSVR